MVIGLTGQTGAGKTTVSGIFKQHGFYVINADQVARQVVEPGKPCLKEISMTFGQNMLNADGSLNRARLAGLVFQDKQQLQRLNDIIFPYITREIEDIISKIKVKFILLDAPTLFESGADKYCDTVLAVLAEKELRINRIIKRDGLTEQQALDRIKSQHSEAFFKAKCQYIIYANGTLEELHRNTLKIIQEIKANNVGEGL